MLSLFNPKVLLIWFNNCLSSFLSERVKIFKNELTGLKWIFLSYCLTLFERDQIHVRILQNVFFLFSVNGVLDLFLLIFKFEFGLSVEVQIIHFLINLLGI